MSQVSKLQTWSRISLPPSSFFAQCAALQIFTLNLLPHTLAAYTKVDPFSFHRMAGKVPTEEFWVKGTASHAVYPLFLLEISPKTRKIPNSILETLKFNPKLD